MYYLFWHEFFLPLLVSPTLEVHPNSSRQIRLAINRTFEITMHKWWPWRHPSPPTKGLYPRIGPSQLRELLDIKRDRYRYVYVIIIYLFRSNSHYQQSFFPQLDWHIPPFRPIPLYKYFYDSVHTLHRCTVPTVARNRKMDAGQIRSYPWTFYAMLNGCHAQTMSP